MALTQVHTHWNTHTLSQNRFLYCDRLTHSKIHTVSFKRCWCQNSAHLCPQDYWSRPESVRVFVLDTSIVRTFGVMRTYCLAPQIENVLLYVCVCVYIHISQLNVLFVSSLTDFTKTHTHTHHDSVEQTADSVCVSSPDFFIHLNVCECVCC